MSKKISIQAFENGPFKMENVKSIEYCGTTNDVAEGKPVFICRCGASKNPPFCDGTHNGIGFTSACQLEETKEERVWEGTKLRTIFDPNICMHVFYCKPLKELRAKEAEDSGLDTAKEIMQVVASCPSGALKYEIKDDSLHEKSEANDVRNVLEIVEGGEVRIRCDVEASFDVKTDQTRLTLCRCGQSKNKPFCDGRHRRLKEFK